jgi:hypothetical protein
VAVLATHAASLWPFTVDDAFISFRYARNLVAGHGLVYNVGERVEGYTNLLWVLLASIPEALGWDTPTFAKTLGLLAALGCLPLTLALARRLGPGDRRGAALTPLLLALQTPFVLWAVSGLETALATMWLLAGIVAYLRETEAKRLPWSGVLFVAAALTRPDTLLGAVLTLLLGAAGATPSGDRRRRAAANSALALAGAMAVWAMWKWQYYGALLPNTLLAKGRTGLDGLTIGAAYLGKHLHYYSLAPAIAVAAGLLAVRRSKAAALPACLVVGYWLYVVLAGGDWMPGARLLAPTFPFLMILALHAGDLAAPRQPLARLAVILLLCLPGLLALSFLPRHEHYQRIIGEEARVVKLYRLLGEDLRGRLPPNATIACDVAGAAPYYSGLRTIDLDGLTDAYIARRGAPRRDGFGKRDMAYALGRRPEVFFLFPPVNPYDPSCWSPARATQIVEGYFTDETLRARFLAAYRSACWSAGKLTVNAMTRNGVELTGVNAPRPADQ